MGNIFEKEKHVNPVVIVLETQTEIDQLFAVLNYAPIGRTLFNENDWWNEVFNFLRARKTSAYNNYHNMLDREIKGN